MVKVYNTTEVRMSFNTIAAAQAGTTGEDIFINVGSSVYEYDAGGTDLTTGDGRTWTLATASGSTTAVIQAACSDELTAITTGTAKVTFRVKAFTVTAVRASLTTASSSGVVTVDINENGTSILSTKLTIDASEKTSTTAATPAVISDASLADDAEITVDIDTAGTGATGLKIALIGSYT